MPGSARTAQPWTAGGYGGRQGVESHPVGAGQGGLPPQGGDGGDPGARRYFARRGSAPPGPTRAVRTRGARHGPFGRTRFRF
ncbi:hypothetical protein GCM10010195_52690 [Kitasatospora griseola]|nr:hypothetical protein GCM10010195_52690 [Kitasatospora griseola]